MDSVAIIVLQKVNKQVEAKVRNFKGPKKQGQNRTKFSVKTTVRNKDNSNSAVALIEQSVKK